MKPDDPRLASIDLRKTFGVDPEGAWPRAGEVTAIMATAIAPRRVPAAPSIRAIVLQPGALSRIRRSTITGQFAGRNLLGDLPDAPAQEPLGFRAALGRRRASGSSGARPKGKGFDLALDARLDTGRWLEVTGVVHKARGLQWLESPTDGIQLGKAPTEPTPARGTPPVRVPAAPPPEVVFSAPTQDETDVAAGDVGADPVLARHRAGDAEGPHPRRAISNRRPCERGEPATPTAEFTMQYTRRQPRPRDEVHQAARTLPHADSRAAGRDSRHRRAAAQAVDADLCRGRILDQLRRSGSGCSMRRLGPSILHRRVASAISHLTARPETRAASASRIHQLRHLDHVIARRQRRERELRDLPARSVGIVAHGGRDRDGERLARCDRAAARVAVPATASESRRAAARCAGTADRRSAPPCSPVAGPRRTKMRAGRVRRCRQRDPQRVGSPSRPPSALFTRTRTQVVARRRAAAPARAPTRKCAAAGRDVRALVASVAPLGGRQRAGRRRRRRCHSSPVAELADGPHRRRRCRRLPAGRGMQANRQRARVAVERRDRRLDRPRFGGGSRRQRARPAAALARAAGAAGIAPPRSPRGIRAARAPARRAASRGP